MPGASDVCGVSHVGFSRSPTKPLSQTGHGDKGEKAVTVNRSVKPGYGGHVPQARDAFGASVYTSP